MKFTDIPQYIDSNNYEINIPLSILESKIQEWINDPFYKLQLNPDFQRGHVWTEEQQVAFVEFFLSGGKTGRVIYFNNPRWYEDPKTGYTDFVIVDGLQRLTAIRAFLSGKIKAFDNYIYEFEDKIRNARCDKELKFNINNLATKKEVLLWYLQMNTGGVVHHPSEIEKVKRLLEMER